MKKMISRRTIHQIHLAAAMATLTNLFAAGMQEFTGSEVFLQAFLGQGVL